MEETKAKLNRLVEFIDQEHIFNSPENRIQLIRILSRSSNLPKVQNINIYLHNDSNGFYIKPGEALQIGSKILGNPVVALIYIRYGLEWQIWYKSQLSHKKDPRICDTAACQVTAKFYDTLSLADKKALIDLPKDFFGIFKKFKTGHDTPVLTAADYKVLGEMHHLKYPSSTLDKEDLKIVRYLAFPLEYLLMSGGDKRLQIDRKQLLNKYGCTPFPRPKAFTFASSTATSISNIAFSQTEGKREKLIEDCFQNGFEKSIKNFSEGIKSSLKKALDLPDNLSVILGPSGTDISLLFAGLCQSLFDKPLVHILVASDETGSGVPAALEGKHFSDRTSQGMKAKKGERIEGFEPVELYPISLRDSNGSLKSANSIDQEVIAVFKQFLMEGKQPILHVMNQSKLGYMAPSTACLSQLEEEFESDFFALIDNSQMRMGRYELGNYLHHNYAMTITGSKFFTGPPFCGALLLPESRESWLASSPGDLPSGLKDYAYKNDFPTQWNSVQKLKQGSNLGTLMRWSAAIVEQDRYFETPVLLRTLGTEMFCTHVQTSIEQADFLDSLIDLKEDATKVNPTASNRSIFPFFIKHHNRTLKLEETRNIYHLLNQKLTNLFEDEACDSTILANQVCHIGQPVKAVHKDGTLSGVVRISIGARVISESWKERDVSLFFQKIQDQMAQVDTIIRKIQFILDHESWWKID